MKETFIEKEVVYTLEYNGKLCVIQNVPARVCVETGEELFSPDTVKKIHNLLRGDFKPVKMIETPVYEYA
jgi:YgiT-type zinc finger domain-containing protein